MRSIFSNCILTMGAIAVACAPTAATADVVRISEATAGSVRRTGLLTTYLDAANGKVWLETPPPTGQRGEIGRFIYVEGLLSGLGSNPVGLDRGQIGPSRVVALRRVGNRILVEQENLRFRALSDDHDEREAVRQSFASSILWAGKIEAEEHDGRALVDFTSFVVRDAHGIARTLKSAGQGSFALDADRSVLDAHACLAFPDNLEFEALLTFKSDDPGREVRATAPAPESVTLVQHHSLVRLPDDGYRPRRFDPRAGSFGITFLDYAAPLGKPLEQRWISRHRLEKVDPQAERSRVKKPIVYYVDRGAPEPLRSALIEGAGWWARAFEAAGFIDAFRVELMPEGAHPLDVRYNVIQWVHRATRGWSYGGSLRDPRTGEIIKGHVSLGSLRVRQDRLIFEGLAGADKTGSGDADDPIELALARIRQLAAHEVGHTLGFAHNFAASTYAGRASVMDYPAPLIGITADGKLDFSNAYARGVGAWDLQAVRYAYSEFTPGTDEDQALAAIVSDSLRKGLLFLTDQDARSAGAANPLASLWDNGPDPVAALEQTLRVRRIALEQFGQRNVARGTPLALLQETLAPLYLFHRYQLEAAVKVIGGLKYTYVERGDGQPLARPTSPEAQRKALDVVLRCVDAEELDPPESVLALIQPRPFGYGENRELFESGTAPEFDTLGALAGAAEIAVSALLQPERCARLVDHRRRDPEQPALQEVLEALVDKAFPERRSADLRVQEARRAIQHVVVADLIRLASNEHASPNVRSIAEAELLDLREKFSGRRRADARVRSHARYLAGMISRYLNREYESAPLPSGPPSPPPGSPIGTRPDFGRCSVNGY